MDPTKFSLSLNRAIEDSKQFAESRGDSLISPFHLIYAMFDDRGVMREMAERNLVRTRPFLDRLISIVQKQSAVYRLEDGRQAMASRTLRELLEHAEIISEEDNSPVVE